MGPAPEMKDYSLSSALPRNYGFDQRHGFVGHNKIGIYFHFVSQAVAHRACPVRAVE